MKKEITCIVCPRGCRITVEGQEGHIDKIENYQCDRGKAYARTEFISPRRILTSSVSLNGVGIRMLPVRSSIPIPRDIMLDCMKQIKKQSVHAPVIMHQIIISDILGTGADMIACMTIE